MKPLRGGEGGTRNMTEKVGADTGFVDHPNANGGAQRPHRSGNAWPGAKITLRNGAPVIDKTWPADN
jgi:hypothetical protein